MRKILVVIEDYSELVFLETLLKRVGLDVLGTQKVSKVDDLVISFAPSLIVLSYPCKQVELKDELIRWKHLFRNMRKIPRFAGLVKSSQLDQVSKIEGLDFVIESPIQVQKLFQSLTEALQLEQGILVQKWQALQSAQSEAKAKKLGQNSQPEPQPGGSLSDSREREKAQIVRSKRTDAERSQKNREFMQGLKPIQHKGLTRSQMVKAQGKIQAPTEEGRPSDQQIDEQQAIFLGLLFDKSGQKK